jgi:threonine/homoserine/homoserine lactone efflux protein
MTYPEALWIFFILLAGIIIVPGMDMIYVMANALTGGRRAGLTATFGIMTGGAFHTLFGVFAVVGMSRLVPQIYVPMLVLGALYMIWIGVTLARSSIVMERVDGSGARSLLTIFAQAVVTCVLNPKAWLFVLAVYPQFIRPGFGPLWSGSDGRRRAQRDGRQPGLHHLVGPHRRSASDRRGTLHSVAGLAGPLKRRRCATRLKAPIA